MNLSELKAATSDHDRLNCDCDLCNQYDKAEYEFTQSLRLTTDHASSSYGLPVLVDGDGIAYGTADITPIGYEGWMLYNTVAQKTGWSLQWEDFGHTLVGAEKEA